MNAMVYNFIIILRSVQYMSIHIQNRRKDIIGYLISVSKAQEQLQLSQQKLVQNKSFNPIILFKLITNYQQQISLIQFKSYIAEQLRLTQSFGIDTYAKKYKLKNIVKIEDFLQTITPHNPMVIRQVLQLQKYHFQESNKSKIHKLYLNVIGHQIFHLLKLQKMRKDLNLDWNYVYNLIQNDLNNRSLISLGDRSQMVIFSIRKWLELWINFDQKQLLNITRWCHGMDQDNIKMLFTQMYSNNIRSLSKNKLIRQKYASEKKNNKISINSPRNCHIHDQYQTNILKSRRNINKNKQSIYKVKSHKQLNQKLHKKQLYQQENIDKQTFDRWLQYVNILIKTQQSQKYLKSNIKDYSYAQIISKMFNEQYNVYTQLNSKHTLKTISINQLIQYITSWMSMTSQQIKHWRKQLENFVLNPRYVENILLKIKQFDIATYNFTNHYLSIYSNQQPKLQMNSNPNMILANIIHLHITTHLRLQYLSKKIQPHIGKLFQLIDINGNKYLSRKSLTQLLKTITNKYITTFNLNRNKISNTSSNIDSKNAMIFNFGQEQVTTILQYFGDGKIITANSLYLKILSQSSSQWKKY